MVGLVEELDWFDVITMMRWGILLEIVPYIEDIGVYIVEPTHML
jgi:hypothetical protein